MRFFIISLFAGLMFLFGCKSDQNKSDDAQTITVQQNKLDYSVPDGWIKEEPKSRMRLAQFRLPGQNGAGDAELAVFVFPGTGGSVKDNLKRWYGQFKQPNGADSEEKADLKTVTVNGMNVTIVYLTGTYLESASPMMMGGPVKEVPSSAMLAAIAETTSDPWFFKAVGPQSTLDHWRASFDEFVRSFRMGQVQ